MSPVPRDKKCSPSLNDKFTSPEFHVESQLGSGLPDTAAASESPAGAGGGCSVLERSRGQACTCAGGNGTCMESETRPGGSAVKYPNSPSLKSSVFFVKLSCIPPAWEMYSQRCWVQSPVTDDVCSQSQAWPGAALLLGRDSSAPGFDEGVSSCLGKFQCHLGIPGPSQCCWPQIALQPSLDLFISAHRVPFTTVSAACLEKETSSGVACFSSGSHFSLSLVILKHTSENC